MDSTDQPPQHNRVLAAIESGLTGIVLAAMCASVFSVLHSGLLMVE